MRGRVGGRGDAGVGLVSMVGLGGRCGVRLGGVGGVAPPSPIRVASMGKGCGKYVGHTNLIPRRDGKKDGWFGTVRTQSNTAVTWEIIEPVQGHLKIPFQIHQLNAPGPVCAGNELGRRRIQCIRFCLGFKLLIVVTAPVSGSATSRLGCRLARLICCRDIDCCYDGIVCGDPEYPDDHGIDCGQDPRDETW